MEAQSIAKATQAFWKDQFATQVTGARIEQVAHEYAECSLILTPRHCNAAGNVMGGVLFTLADLAFAVAANNEIIDTVASDQLWMSLDSTIHYLRRTKGKKLIATAQCIKSGQSISLYEIKITDDNNQLIATIETTGIRSTKK